MRERTAELRGIKDEVERGIAKATEQQHAKGKLTARERIALLFDEGSFQQPEPKGPRTPKPPPSRARSPRAHPGRPGEPDG
ncbi:hypothetical protein [Streptomyces sp. NPDC056682]|uniref:hypothetical protein n=1 Tax=Streptomyces sp. NPDC056682 TaxID=3345909 RepID=UPI00369255D7